jgi:prolyl 4-hydroxylase
MPLPAYHHSGRCQARAKSARFTQGERAVKGAVEGFAPLAQRPLHGKRKLRERRLHVTLLRRRESHIRRLRPLRARLSLITMIDLGDSVVGAVAGQPGVQRMPTSKAEIFQVRRFAPPDLCADLIALVEQDRRPSTIADDNGDAYFRTSETCDMAADLPPVQRVESLITQLCGIDPAYGEPLQGQRYDVGQEFKPHTDYFTPGGRDFAQFCTLSGNRTWTFMIYLNDVAAGGATRFKLLDKTFQPEAGKLLFWNNRLPDGSVNQATLHHGMKVRKGIKYVITKWYREREWRG